MERRIICLDTSILIDYYRKTDKTNSVFYQLTKDANSIFVISIVTEYEILVGAKEGEQKQFWLNFFKRLSILSFGSKEAQIAPEIHQTLKLKRKSITIPDLFIAVMQQAYQVNKKPASGTSRAGLYLG